MELGPLKPNYVVGQMPLPQEASKEINAVVDRQMAVARGRGITASSTLKATGSLNGHSIRLKGPVDGAALLYPP